MATPLVPASHNCLPLRRSPPILRRSSHALPSAFPVRCSAGKGDSLGEDDAGSARGLKSVTLGVLAAWAVATASPVIAAGQIRLPPLSTEPDRCERAFVGNTIGQANGVYDKPIDLRFCDYTNEKSNLKGKSLAAALMSDAKFDGADMSEVVMSKAYAVGASFKGVDFSNAVLDRDAVFDDTIIGYIDLQKLCTNTTITEDGRATLGCR
ncbi:hypothetical protein MLD38_015710 [Melastoma candidum]|uniref:Uncharacterized protein n=1 Tax=Melastoma candidum TaxID=119954 RepID=A0ACB9RH49_9MYRT|nr:hypothetical protein MLD38_015710 [Melastoma candidum]